MPYKIKAEVCLKCGLCVKKCPREAIIPGEKIYEDYMVLQPVSIDPTKCDDCGVCVSEEYWCPAKAITKA